VFNNVGKLSWIGKELERSIYHVFQGTSSDFVRRDRGKSRITLVWMAGNVPEIRNTYLTCTSTGLPHVTLLGSYVNELGFVKAFHLCHAKSVLSPTHSIETENTELKLLVKQTQSEGGCLLGCSTGKYGRYWPTFQRSLLPPSSGRWISRAFYNTHCLHNELSKITEACNRPQQVPNIGPWMWPCMLDGSVGVCEVTLYSSAVEVTTLVASRHIHSWLR
jgi:hypothetical protein